MQKCCHHLYVFEFQTEKVEEEDEEKAADEDDAEKEEDEDAKVEEEDESKKSNKKTVEKTVWDWVLVNENKPLWTKK